ARSGPRRRGLQAAPEEVRELLTKRFAMRCPPTAVDRPARSPARAHRTRTRGRVGGVLAVRTVRGPRSPTRTPEGRAIASRTDPVPAVSRDAPVRCTPARK